MKELLHHISGPKIRKPGAFFEPKYAKQIKQYLEKNFPEEYTKVRKKELAMNLYEHLGNQIYGDVIRIIFNMINELSKGNSEVFKKFKYWILDNIDPI